MDMLISAYYISCYSVNLVNIVFLAMLYLRKREALYGFELMFMISLMTISTSLSLPCILSNSPDQVLPQAVSFVLYVFLILGICLVAGSAPAYVNSFARTKLGNTVTKAAWIASLIILGATLAETFLTESNKMITVCFFFMVASSLWAVGWFIYRIFKDRSLLSTCDSARVTLIMCFATIVFMPLIVAFDFWGASVQFLPPDSSERIIVVPLFLAIWSALLLRKNVRNLMRHVDATRPGAQATGLDSLNISEREKEVLDLLVRGLSYEAIADKLFISHSTVKTHISRIYRKTGVSNKIELISRINADDHPKS